MDWRARAACRGTPDPDLFFPPVTTGPAAARQVAAAKAICAHCPVQAQCRTWALGHEAYGIWGGLTEHQRAHLRRTTPGDVPPGHRHRHCRGVTR